MDRTYIAIDLKSFYASVECMERNVDPLSSFLVVADPSRTSKTICLAVSPALKAFGIKGRPRLFEVEQQVKRVNDQRIQTAPNRVFTGQAFDKESLLSDPGKELAFLIAPPQMAHYIKISTKIYETYLKFVAPEDIHVYSIDEVFIDATPYLQTYRLTAHDFAMNLILEVLSETGITATAGIGPNLYLAKVAMDIGAKHIEPDQNGVRIAELTEQTYREKLWTHTPITDFWRVGNGYGRKLESHGIRCMGDVARCSLVNEELLFNLFGVNAELLIDHAWGYEPCTIAEIKAYKPEHNSIGSGQVLQEPYSFDKALLVVKEMADQIASDLVDKQFVSSQFVLTVGFDIQNLTDSKIRQQYKGPIRINSYGKQIPKEAHGTTNLDLPTSSSLLIRGAMEQLFRKIVNPLLLIRRINIAACRVLPRDSIQMQKQPQLDLFSSEEIQESFPKEEVLERERKLQETMNQLKKRFGKNAVLRGMSLQEGATAKQRNEQIGGHKA